MEGMPAAGNVAAVPRDRFDPGGVDWSAPDAGNSERGAGMRIFFAAAGLLALALSASAALAQAGQQPALNLPPGISFPMCDGTHSDQCLQLGQNSDLDRRVDQLYPQCAKLGDPRRKGACVNAAMAKR
jgi:hypothetical protein